MSGRRRGTRVRKVSAAAAEAAAAADSDDDEEEEATTPTTETEAAAATATVTPEKKKKKRAPIVKVESLILEKKWSEIRKRLKRVASPKRVGALLHHTADNPDVPDDIFRLLFAKLQDKREYTPEKIGAGGKPWSIRHEFWSCVCNVNADDVYSKKFGQVCLNRTPTSLCIFLQEYVNIIGTLHQQSARETILFLWADYIFSSGTTLHGSYAYHEQMCPKVRQEELMRVTCKQDLVDNEALYDVWTKTELLIKMTVPGGLEKSVDGDEDDDDDNKIAFPLIHALIQVEVPKFIVWLALKLYPAQAKVLDELGRLPLHWAAVLNNTKTDSSFYVSFDQIDVLKDKTTTMVELVFDTFPAGAGYADKNGSHPLALLLHLDYTSWTTNDGWTRRCVMLLLKQAPEALHELNGENRMLPFLTAACMHEDNTCRAQTKGEELEKSLRQLNLSYEILRQDPTVVARGVKESSREVRLRAQLSEAQDLIRKLQADQRKLQDEVARLRKRNDDDDDYVGNANDLDDNDDGCCYDVESASHQQRCSKRIRLDHGGGNN